MGYKIWKLIIVLINTIIAVVFIPFIVYYPELNRLVLSITDTSLLVWLIVAAQILNAISSIVSLSNKKKIQISGSIVNISLSLILIIMLSILVVTEDTKLLMSLILMMFTGIDGAICVAKNTIKSTSPKLGISVERENSIDSISLKDSNELKTRIINMQTGLNKSFEEAVEEIEKTGELSGLKIGKLDDDNADDNRIVPLSLEEIEQKTLIEDDKEVEVNNIRKIDYDDDYASIRETSLSRKNDIESNLLSKEEYDEWETH